MEKYDLVLGIRLTFPNDIPEQSQGDIATSFPVMYSVWR